MSGPFPHRASERLQAWRAPLAIAVAAFALRLAVASALPGLGRASDDAMAYRDLAHNLLRSGRYVTTIDPPHRADVPYATRPPLVPFCLAASYRLFGERPVAEHLLLALVGALACVATYRLGEELFGRAVGAIAAGMAAVYPFFLALAVIPLTESLNILLYPALLLYVIRFCRRGSLGDASAAGAMLGLSTLCKPVIATAYPLLAACFFLGKRRPARRIAARGALLMALVATLVVLPWTLRNLKVMGAFVPVSLQFGSVLLQGMGPTSDHAITLLESGIDDGWHNPPWFASVYPSDPDPVVADRKAARLALAYVTAHPREAAALAWRKVRLFWGSYPNWPHRLSWAILAALSVGGLWLSRRYCGELLPVYLLLAHTALIPVVFTSMPRFRAPIEPILMLFAAFALLSWRGGVR